ncbi:Metallo-dependent hydrolase [Setomelanomma holmii]|uniref:Probable guanine deaminase n=1 Tax=Setomelanomma holmii TaxID=210430 RepID=A0A9P4GZT3_9PLEO|nr:Metallo-dependent hydrolase [Setomelanomma holmii]
MTSTVVFQGSVIHSQNSSTLEILDGATLIVQNGLITAFHKTIDHLPPGTIPDNAQVHHLPAGNFLFPGFVDTHNHAPQWPMRGRGQGLHILDWLDQVTFPVEARFADPEYASRIYDSTIDDFLRHGITTASYYSSRHAEATHILADTCHRKGQRAFIGKCNMDRNAPDYICEVDAETSLRETQECIDHIRDLPGHGQDASTSLVWPVVTPRFAISCTPQLLQGLGDLVKQDQTLAVQTHFNEAQQEIDATTSLFPEFNGSEADLYEHFGLLNKRSILAHCTIMTDYEKERIHALQCGVAHCPIANMTVGGGFMVAPIRDFLSRGLKVGLGTDSGGGWASQMLAVMRQALIASNAREVLSAGKDKALSLEEVFYLATMGGARVLCLEDHVGNFDVGKEFDAVWVRTTSGLQSAMTPVEKDDTLRTMFEKFVLTGDDRNMAHVFVRGRRVAGAEKEEAFKVTERH